MKIRAKILFCLLCIFLLLGCQSSKTPQGISAQVQRVISGNTIEVVVNTNTVALIERVRLLGIEAPDLQQSPWGMRAKEKLEQLLAKNSSPPLVFQSVVLESPNNAKDRFGRRLAYVWCNGILVNETLVKEGYALASSLSQTQDHSRFLSAQEYARLMGYEIWNPEQPMRLTPTEFRSQTYSD